jgi:predicted chitinase
MVVAQSTAAEKDGGMNRTDFFNAIRPAFGGTLSQPQVDGMNAILDAAASLPLHHVAHILAHVRRETAGHMAPIKETVMPWHKNKNPTDKEVMRRLDVAFAAGKLKGVKAPYWRDGWFGRGQIQITHRENYARFGISNPDDAMKPAISAHIAVVGMRDGMFRRHKLADYTFPRDLDSSPATHPRRIVNGNDGSDAEVSRFHREFAAALEQASTPMVSPLTPKPVADSPAPETDSKAGLWGRIIAALGRILGGR